MVKDIVLVGAGRVAFHLAKRLSSSPEYRIVQVFSRHQSSAEALIEEALAYQGVQAIDDVRKLRPNADIYIFSLSDSALETVWSQMPKTKGLWLHTAGSVALSPMVEYNERSAVLYPLQTFSKERELDWSNLPLYLEVNKAQDRGEVELLAQALSPKIEWVDSRTRAKLHCSAVFACNFTNHLIDLSERLLQGANLDTKVLLPLIDETLAKLHELPAKEAQTGPAIRGDKNTMQTHLEALSDKPDLCQIYELLSQSIQAHSEE